MSTDLFEKVQSSERLDGFRRLRDADVLPYYRRVDGHSGATVVIEGREQVMLGSNNYLGLASDPRVMEGAREALDSYGAGLTGSRLLNGTTALHHELEAEVAGWLGTDDALVFTTGYQANVGLIAAMVESGDAVVCDSGNHASIHDGVAMSSARIRPFRHGRLDRLQGVLKRSAADNGGVLVAIDGVFSMEGDIADLSTIVQLCGKFGARLMVDEAHAMGVLGSRGTGTAELFNVEDQVDLRMGTFSKALATCGGFVAGKADVIEFLRIEARPLIFTTASVPAALGAALVAVQICRSDEGPERFAAVLANARYLYDGLRQLGLDVGEPSSSPGGEIVTPIIPVRVGDDASVILLWKKLYEDGIFCNVALYPAVAEGHQLLRTCVMATHTRDQLDRAIEAFSQAIRAGFAHSRSA